MSRPGRPPRLESVFQSYDRPLYFVTICAFHRQRLLANESVHLVFREFAQRGFMEKSIATGRYVLLPDHLHVFVSGPDSFDLRQWVRMLKTVVGKRLLQLGHKPEFWQRGFFDHLIRNSESYEKKWAYVYQNPVRAGLVGSAEDWPYQGEILPVVRP